MLSAFSLILTALIGSSGSAGANVATDQAQITALKHKIAAQGERVKSLVSRYNELQAQVSSLDVQLADSQRLLAADERAETAAKLAARRVAVRAYTSNSGMDSTLALLSGTASITATLSQNQYLGAVNSRLGDALNALRVAQDRTEAARSNMRSKQARATKSLRDLTKAHDAATSAIASDEATLSHVSGDLRSLLAVADEQRQAAKRTAERGLAAAGASPQTQQTASVAAPSPGPSPPPGPSRSSGAYANPLRAITALTPERIDQGVDFAGFGPIYAIGNGVVLNTLGNGWPGGTFIAYRLTEGPANGLVVFAAEDIAPSVQVGDTVTSNTVLGHMYAGPDGIEMGWADGNALPNTMARSYGQYNGSNPTAFGVNFSRFLQGVGAPGGVQDGLPTGQLPRGWPQW